MFEVRPITREEIPAFIRVHSMVYGRHPSETYHRQAQERFDEQRDIGVFDGDDLIGSSVIHDFRLTVPGGAVERAGGITNVAVRPTHRRRGALTRLMHDHMTRLHADGIAYAMLWASESLIYNRFGYGLATWTERWRIEQPRTTLLVPAPEAGGIDFVDAETARAEWPDVMARAMAGRPGFFPRNRAFWETFHEDLPEQRDGASAYFHAVYRPDGPGGRIEGYATYRVTNRWPERIFANELRIREVMAVTDEAARALWHFLLGIDLVAEVSADLRPLDDPLPWLLADTRRLRRLVQDGLWLRLVDVRAALERRAYRVTDSMVIEVRDPFCDWNAGRIRLEVGPDGAHASPTKEAPDLTADAWALAAVYLGGTRPSAIAAAGRGFEAHAADALARADAIFATDRAPWAPVFF
ncbi:MAG: GNAT family N-acetyltransferase [Dehalococcoidia bacterium]